MDEETEFEVAYVRSEKVQLCEALVLLAQNVDVCRDDAARTYLLSAMSSLVYELNPPKGELRDIKNPK